MQNPRWLRTVICALGATMLLASCGTSREPANEPAPDTNTTETSDVPKNGMVGEDAGGEPKQGGTMVVAMIGQPRVLDPAATIASSSTGGIEMINVFDSLMRYDTETDKVVPQLAEDVRANDDSSEFTITLRDGVQFSDGTPLNAEAVTWSMERYTAAKTAPEGALWKGAVKSITATDERTVTIALNYGYPGFVNLLASGPGMIVAESSGEGEAFKPVGAGPFTFESLTMGESAILNANPNYWDGAPNLESLRFVYLGPQTGSLEAQEKGDVQLVVLSAPDLIEQKLDEGQHGYLNMTSGWAASLINGSEGRPGSDPRVRRALELAIDPQVLVDRAYHGKGLPTNRLFPEGSKWYSPDATVPEPNVEEAKKLLEEAKADGFDGNIEYIASSDPASKSRSLALKAQWDAAGFNVTVTNARTVADIITAGINKDYDMIQWGLNFRESDPYAKMAALMHSTGTQTFGMPTSPEMDALIEEFRQAPSDEEAHRVMTEIETKFHEDVPFLSHIGSWDFTQWDAGKVQGVVGASTGMVLLGNAWIE